MPSISYICADIIQERVYRSRPILPPCRTRGSYTSPDSCSTYVYLRNPPIPGYMSDASIAPSVITLCYRVSRRLYNYISSAAAKRSVSRKYCKQAFPQIFKYLY
jgi:hypothetical protein